MNTSLYTLATEYATAAERLADLELDEQTITDTLDGLGGALELKAANVAMFALNAEYLAAAIKAREQALAERRKALENRAARVRRYLVECMQAGGVSKIETPDLRLSLRDNPARVVVDMPNAIPDPYWRIPEPPPPEIDKAALLRDLKAGKEISGVHLERGQRVDIK